jgi:hypothetical protein
VRIGPVLYRDQGWGHLKLDATAVLRTESSFSGATPDVGHEITGEVRAGRQFGVSVGGRLFDVVRGVEEWQLSNAEVALASFFFHRDYRDYYGRHGGSCSPRCGRRRTPISRCRTGTSGGGRARRTIRSRSRGTACHGARTRRWMRAAFIS